MKIRIVRLDAHHQREQFDCGNPVLNEFLRKQAGQQQRRGFGKTYVALAENGLEVIGYVTLSAGQIASQSLPQPPSLPRSAAPILRIGRLAVDLQSQGNGIARHLLSFALKIALEFSETVGLYAVLIDAKDARAAGFYQQLGFSTTLDNPLCLFLPVSHLLKASKD
jgi:GNAT superfamily N-acetyltransferase